MSKRLISELEDRRFPNDFGCGSYLSWFFFSFCLYKDEKKSRTITNCSLVFAFYLGYFR